MNDRLRELMDTGIAVSIQGGTQYEVRSDRPTRALLRELDIRFTQTTCTKEGTPFFGKRILLFVIYDSDHVEHPDHTEQHVDELLHQEFDSDLDQTHQGDGNVALADAPEHFVDQEIHCDDPPLAIGGIPVQYVPELEGGPAEQYRDPSQPEPSALPRDTETQEPVADDQDGKADDVEVKKPV